MVKLTRNVSSSCATLLKSDYVAGLRTPSDSTAQTAPRPALLLFISPLCHYMHLISHWVPWLGTRGRPVACF